MTYHYSLPVYTLKYLIKEFQLDANGDPYLMQRNVCDNEVHSLVTRTFSKSAYANSWKLTAITGPDFVDKNQNNYPDENDEGYWILINYGKWTINTTNFKSNIIEQSPYFGCNINVGYNKFWSSHFDDNIVGTTGSNSSEEKELYYPNYIKTATQTAFFVKDIRLDAHGVPNVGNNHLITPKLFLKELIIIDNEDVEREGVFTNLSSTYIHENYNLNGKFNLGGIIKYTDYISDSANINQFVLSSIAFNTDYSLAKGVHNNIIFNSGDPNNPNNLTLNPKEFAEVLVYYDVEDPDISNTGINNNKGKLTLRSLTFYGYQRKKIHSKTNGMASFSFDYTKSESGSGDGNPNYRYRKKDFYGYYRHDNMDSKYASLGFPLTGFLTKRNQAYSDAWSLKEITLPTQGKIKIDYESDDYTRVGSRYNMGSTTPKRFFTGVFVQSGPTQTGPTELVTFSNPDAFHLNDEVDLQKIKLYYEKVCEGIGYYKTFRIANEGTGPLVVNDNNSHILNCYEDNFSSSSVCGNVKIKSPFNIGLAMYTLNKAYGGGVRTKTISYKEPVQNQTEPLFEYFLDFNYKNGYVGSEPGYESSSGMLYDADFFEFNSPKLALVDRYSPSSKVGYDSVEVIPRGKFDNQIGKKLFTFFNDPESHSMQLVEGELRNYDPHHNNEYTGSYFSFVVTAQFMDFNRYGRPITISDFDNENRPLSKTTFKYWDLFYDFDFGSIEEVFYRYSKVGIHSFEGAYIRRERNSYLKEIVSRVGNVETIQSFRNFDVLTGKPSTVHYTSNSNDPQYSIIDNPAYTSNPQMGSKIEDQNNSHQLTTAGRVKDGISNSSNLNFIFSNAINCRVFSSILGDYETINQNIKNSIGVKSYRSNGELLPENWDPELNFTIFDENQNLLESKDAFNNYQANKIASNKSLVIAKGAMTNYASFFHTSFEYKEEDNYFDNEIHSSAGVANSKIDFQNSGIHAHSGNFVAKVANAETLKYSVKRSTANVNEELVEQGILPGRTYEASVWVHTSSPTSSILEVTVDGISLGQSFSSSVSINKSNSDNLIIDDWVLMKVNFEVPEDFTTPNSNHGITVSCKNTGSQLAYFDDFRLQPIDAEVEAYVYDNRRELPLFVLDNENFYSRFEYNPAGAVVRSYRETELGEKIIQETTNQYPK